MTTTLRLRPLGRPDSAQALTADEERELRLLRAVRNAPDGALTIRAVVSGQTARVGQSGYLVDANDADAYSVLSDAGLVQLSMTSRVSAHGRHETAVVRLSDSGFLRLFRLEQQAASSASPSEAK